MAITLFGPHADKLEQILESGWELLVFKAHPHPTNKKLFDKMGYYGAGWVDTSGDISREIEDFHYGHSIQEAVLEAIDDGPRED